MALVKYDKEQSHTYLMKAEDDHVVKLLTAPKTEKCCVHIGSAEGYKGTYYFLLCKGCKTYASAYTKAELMRQWAKIHTRSNLIDMMV